MPETNARNDQRQLVEKRAGLEARQPHEAEVDVREGDCKRHDALTKRAEKRDACSESST